MRVVAVIPARAGSKRLPGKNVRPLGGRPLIAWSIEDALQAKSVERVIVSTDSAETAEVARREGAEAPFLRPPEIAGDKVSDTPVLAHVADWLEREEGYVPDALILLRPTVPFRADDLIDRCVSTLFDLGADSVRSVRDMRHWHPYWMLQRDEQGFATPFIEGKGVDVYYQSQLLPPVYRHDGYCDVVRRANLPSPCPPDATLAGFYGKRMATVLNPEHYFVNIDDLADFELAEWVLARAAAGGDGS